MHIVENQPRGDTPAPLPGLWTWELSFITVPGPVVHTPRLGFPTVTTPGGGAASLSHPRSPGLVSDNTGRYLLPQWAARSRGRSRRFSVTPPTSARPKACPRPAVARTHGADPPGEGTGLRENPSRTDERVAMRFALVALFTFQALKIEGERGVRIGSAESVAGRWYLCSKCPHRLSWHML